MGPEVAVGAEVASTAAAGSGAAAGGLTAGQSAALIAAGTAMQVAAQQQQARQQRTILNRQFEAQDKTQQEATKDTLTEAQNMTPGAQMAAMQAASDKGAAQTMADLKGAGADIIDTAPGRTSGAFAQALQTRTAEEGTRASKIARELASVRAPGLVQAANARARSALAERLGSQYASQRALAQAAQLDASSVERPIYGDIGTALTLAGSLGYGGGAEAAAGNSGAYALDGGVKLGEAGATAAPAQSIYAVDTTARLGDMGANAVKFSAPRTTATAATAPTYSRMAQALPMLASMRQRSYLRGAQ